jgi:hypothetical protein
VALALALGLAAEAVGLQNLEMALFLMAIAGTHLRPRDPLNCMSTDTQIAPFANGTPQPALTLRG